ncbi:MAG TPA: M2 family metallopeptidase, partial [Polyangia bacterium]
MRLRPIVIGIAAGVLCGGALSLAAAEKSGRKPSAAEKEARAFLETVTGLVQPLTTVANQAAWVSSTDVSPEHTAARTAAEKAAAAAVGSKLVIERTAALLAKASDLSDSTLRQLRKLQLAAAENPGTMPDLVSQRIEAEGRQSSVLDGYSFCLQPGAGGKCSRPTSANEIDQILRHSRVMADRERAWQSSKEIGRPLKPGLMELQALRNRIARGMGFSSFFGMQVADYGMTTDEMMTLMNATLEATKPLYDGLHCLAKHALADRYKKSVPKLIPAHWVGNRWAQAWPGLIEGASLDPLFKGKTPDFIMRTSEDFYVSLGFPRLPEGFWKKSDLFPVPPNSPRKKNAHASAWHIDGDSDVRSLMSVEPNQQWFGTAHHELGHIYYFLSYATPEVPYLLRAGANRAFHEAVGELARLASQQIPYLRKLGLIRPGQEPDAAGMLMQSALEFVVFLPFAAGTMTHFEYDLYERDLPVAEWQDRWWQYVSFYQGVVPPGTRAPDLCDACTKTHINDDPAQYYDYAMATLIKFQLHDHICRKIVQQEPRQCDYSGSEAAGKFLRDILKLGATRDWRKVMLEATGEEIGPRAMLDFYRPVLDELGKKNQGL